MLTLCRKNLSITQEQSICTSCAENLQKSFDFKALCLYTEDFITPFVNPDRDSFVNLSEIYGKKQANRTSITENQMICRLCLKLLTDKRFMRLYRQDEDVKLILDFIAKYIPELNLTLTEKPVACQACLDSLKDYSTFVEDCMNIENKIEVYYKAKGIDRKHQVKLYDVLQFSLKQTLGDEECLKIISDMEERLYGVRKNNSVEVTGENLTEFDYNQFDVTGENFHIKTEPEEDIVLSKVNNEIDIKQCNGRSLMVVLEMLKPTDIESKEEIENCKRNSQTKYAKGKLKKYKCNICGYETKYRLSFINHDLVHKDPSEINWFQCQICPYKGMRKEDLTRHLFTHPTLSEQKIYKCEKCTYQTYRPDFLRKHGHVHKDASEIKWFCCQLCTYKGKRRAHLQGHMLTHENKKIKEMYKCNKCIYQSKNRSGLRQHMICHMDASEVKMHSCKHCSFKSRYKPSLLMHMRKHLIQPGKYKCEWCSFVTIYEESLKKHIISHKDPSEIIMYSCAQCSFKSRTKSQLLRHIIKFHMDQSKITMYSCSQCNYKTPFKGEYNRHVFDHRDASEVTMHSCKFCPYKSRHKKVINKHILIHKDKSEVTTYACDICTFETRYKNYLAEHMLKHEPLKNPRFCCDICGFASNVRSNIIKHIRKHKQGI